MSDIPLGGRGRKAPYKSHTVRVPDPLIDRVTNICNLYRQAIVSNKFPDLDTQELLDLVIFNERLTKKQVIDEAQKIIKKRRNARVSLEMLLKALYKDEDIKL